MPGNGVRIDVDITETGTWYLGIAVKARGTTSHAWASTPLTDSVPIEVNHPVGRLATVSVPGQTRYLTFHGSAGDQMTFGRDGTWNGSVVFRDPNGNPLVGNVLPATGTYTIAMTAGASTDYGYAVWFLSTPKVDSAPLTMNDPNGRLTNLDVRFRTYVFTASADKSRYLTFRVNRIQPHLRLVVTVRAPSGVQRDFHTKDQGDVFIWFNLPDDGEYTISIRDEANITGPFELWVSQ